jgi:hypothetical protein
MINPGRRSLVILIFLSCDDPDNSFKVDRTRSFISLATLFVNVIARMCRYLEGSGKISFRYSRTRVKVFPEPADDLYTTKDNFENYEL